MKLLVDLNVLLDVVLARQPHVAASASVLAGIENGDAEGFISAHAVTTLYYLIQKQLGGNRAKEIVRRTLATFQVAAVDQKVLCTALELDNPDFEDAVSAAAAQHSGCRVLITRDVKGFRNAAVQAITPETAVAIILKR